MRTTYTVLLFFPNPIFKLWFCLETPLRSDGVVHNDSSVNCSACRHIRFVLSFVCLFDPLLVLFNSLVVCTNYRYALGVFHLERNLIDWLTQIIILGRADPISFTKYNLEDCAPSKTHSVVLLSLFYIVVPSLFYMDATKLQNRTGNARNLATSYPPFFFETK